ncbi:hypothetical protein RHGRI_014118 [Rhododendron griersonianum]|uniref:Uncharacterized protein n=1 Tax=Rhododendron griersonianum TaxID=479676 RepID=A0AAV6K852_9ERIC|nr:hypothetical protein RHGRI_014118 [Rhododendron griersonianum]
MPGQLHQPAQQADLKMPSEVGSQMPRQLHQSGEQVDLNLVDPNGELHTHLMGAETSTPNLFETHEDIVGKLKGDKYISSLSSNISYQMPFEVERQLFKQVEPNHVDPIRQPLTPLRGVHTC